MTKRRTARSDDYFDGNDDDPIGLTGAFQTVKDPQSVEYDKDDNAIGLTQAFARVGSDEGERDWDEEDKWDGFDWNADWDASAYAGDSSENQPGEGTIPPDAEDTSARPEQEAGRAVDQADTAPRSTAHEIDVEKDLAHATVATSHDRGVRRGSRAAHAKELSPRMKRSHRTRRRLILIVVLLVIAAAALGYFAFRTLTAGQEEAAHTAQEQIEATKPTDTETEANDAIETAVQLADVPKLTSLLGKSSDQAVKSLKRGAIVSSNQKAKDKKSPIKTNLTIALSNEPSDSKMGAPNVYLGLNKKGKVIQAGYSASAAALGFGSLSFADAVNNEHVIEKTLGKIGVEVEEGTVKLPKDNNEYTTYKKDKKTVAKERCSFEGEVDVDGIPCTWSAVLSYDYTTQIITGNLADTVRVIYVYITQK